MCPAFVMWHAQGTLNLARAKYSMMGGVGEAQYDLDMKATSTISVTGGWPSLRQRCILLCCTCLRLSPATSPCCCFPEGAGSDGSSTSMYSSTFTLMEQPVSSRQPAAGSCESSSNTGLGSKGSNGDEAGSSGRPHCQKDPALWFGVLVPPALRDAQADFRKGER